MGTEIKTWVRIAHKSPFRKWQSSFYWKTLQAPRANAPDTTAPMPVWPWYTSFQSKQKMISWWPRPGMWFREVKITTRFHFPSAEEPAQDSSVCHARSAAPESHPCARAIKHTGNLIGPLWGGVFPLLSNPMKPGLAGAAGLKEWLHVQSPWRLESGLPSRGRHLAFSLSGFLISTADY